MRFTVPALVAILILQFGLFTAPANGQFCNGAIGDCLIAHPTPGCNDIDCCTLVCSSDPLCCEIDWDGECVHNADISCAGLCGASASGDCFVAHISPACDDETCCATVCALDPYCCESHWDTTCAFEASLNCRSSGTFACGDPGAGSCTVPHGNPACNDLACCTAICSFDPYCCDVTWDLICASLALSTCVESCDTACPVGGVNETESCGEDLNDPCYFASPNPSLQTLVCGALVCGRVTTFTSPVFKPDVDVYKVTLTDSNGDGLTGVRLSFASAFNGFACLVPAAGCASLASALTHVNSSLCAEVLGELTCVVPGDYRIVVAVGDWPTVNSTSVECGINNKYLLRVLCAENGCGPPCNPTAGPCFEIHKGVGCNDVACCEVICAQDPACCIMDWDESCALAAIKQCAPPVPNDVCANATTVGEGAVEFTTIGADSEGSDVPPINCSTSGGDVLVHDIWFHYRPSKDAVVNFSTCGNPLTFNSAMAVYQGSCSALQFLACNDDGGGPCFPASASMVQVGVDCGVDYYVRIGGGYGDGTLTISFAGSGAACPLPCPADLDGNGIVNSADLAILLGAWSLSGPGDLDGNGTVGSADLGILLGEWGPC